MDQVKNCKFGARPIARLIQRHIEDSLAQLIINKTLVKDQKITFYLKDDKIINRIKEIAPREESA